MQANNTKPSSFAPVIIPTLCRHEHFKQCLESLMKCTWAEQTDVYIGLDYPAKESHWNGYKIICEYLDSIENTHTFKSLNVIKREKNYGFGPNGNLSTLRKYVFSFSESIIVSEDDNIFSPAFLDYINKGLELFKDDPSVLAINGYRHFYDVKFDNNTFYRQNVDFSAWGYGIWKDKFYRVLNCLNTKFWRTKALRISSWKNIYLNGWNRVLGFLTLIAKEQSLSDNNLSVYMGISKMDVIMPQISMVRNMGWDGSGEHCTTQGELGSYHSTQNIWKKPLYNYIGTGNEHYFNNHEVYTQQSYGKMTFSQFIKNLFILSKKL